MSAVAAQEPAVSRVEAMIEQLNSRQREAVTQPLQSCLVLAGAGSGKTSVLTARICWVIEKEGVSPDRILAVTFTNKAAEEMRRRLRRLVGDEAAAKMWIGTFHGLCNRILREEHAAAGLPQGFAILDVDSQVRLVRQIIKDRSRNKEEQDESSGKRDSPAAFVKLINAAKEKGRGPWDVDEVAEGAPFDFVEVFVEYAQQCKQQGLLDFNDLQSRALALLKSHEDVANRFKHRFAALFVDEFQDTNDTQYEWLQCIVGPRSCVMAVGDDDQSIYRFRGAEPKNMGRFLADFARNRKIALEQNYRSQPFVLEAANAVINNNTGRLGKTLFSARKDLGERIMSVACESEYEEAEQIAKLVTERLRRGAKPKDLAVLYRTNTQSRLIEHALLRAGVNVTVYGGYKFYDREEIKNLVAYLDLATNVTRDIALSRVVNVPGRGIGERTVQALRDDAKEQGVSMLEMIAIRSERGANDKKQQALDGFLNIIFELAEVAERTSLSEFMGYALKLTGLEDYYGEQATQAKSTKTDREDAAQRMENLISFQDSAEQFEHEFLAARKQAGDAPPEGGWRACHVLPDLMAEIALMTSTSEADMNKKKTVSLMTVHASKGLEFEHVVIAGLEEGIFPHARSLGEELDENGEQHEARDEIEEERRLMYVAITRAKRSLAVFRAISRRGHDRKPALTKPSRFLSEIPASRLRCVETGSRKQQVSTLGRLAKPARP